MRRFHRWLGLGSAVIVLLSVITGLLWAYAPYLYWHEGYLEKKHAAPTIDLAAVSLTHQEAARLARERIGSTAEIGTITLRSELGEAFYEIVGKAGKTEFTVLIDAAKKTVLSPISPELAGRLAGQYVAGSPGIASVDLLEEFKHRSGKVHPSIYQVRFDTPRRAEIFLSALSGRIVEDQDEIRRFHFWVMRLHQLNFFGFKKTLTIIPGIALLAIVVSGFWLGRRRRRAGKEILTESVQR